MIALPVRDAHPHRRRLAEAERDHEGNRCPLKRDAMGSKLDRADPPHKQRRRREQADLGENGDADREAQADDIPQGMPIRPPQMDEDLVATHFFPALNIADDEDEAGRLYGNGDDGRTMKTERRHAEMTEHQGIGKHSVHDKHGDGHIENDAGTADSTHEGANDVVEQSRQQGEMADGDVVAGQLCHIGLLSRRQKDLLGI